MKKPNYAQPDTLLLGNRYYLRSSPNGKVGQFSEVTFVGYRPHPGEIIIDDGSGPRMVHRHLLYMSVQPLSGASDSRDDSAS